MRFNEYAKSIGKTRGYINKLYLEGRLDKAIFEDENGHKRIHKEIADNILNGSNVKTTVPSNSIDLEFEALTYDQSRRMKIFYEAKTEKVKYEKEIKKLIPAEDVEKEAFKTHLILRDRIFSLPAQISPTLLGMKSIFEIQNTLSEALRKIFEAMCVENLNTTEKNEQI